MKLANVLLSVVTMSFTAVSFASEKSQPALIKLDGSSTVFPVAEAAAEEFQKLNPGIRVTVGLSGTGGGMKKFSAGEIDIVNASRKMKDEEVQKAQLNKISYFDLPLASDGITLVVNPANTWATQLSMAQLKTIWEPSSSIKTWRDIDPKWPNEPIKLYGPGADSGTFDFFTEVVMGKAKMSRSDYIASEDDNVLVTGVSKDKYALGYFGYAYFVENKNKLKALALVKEGKTIESNLQTINDGSYPLSRPLLIYVNSQSAKRPEVKKFIEFWLKNTAQFAKEVGYVPLKEALYLDAIKKFQTVN